MIGVIDKKHKRYFVAETQEEINNFCDKYEHPNELEEAKIIYFDGSGSNGIYTKICFGYEKKFQVIKLPKTHTNNEVEYFACIEACLLADPYTIIIGDSKLIVNQITELYKCNNKNLGYLCLDAKNIIKKKNLFLHWVRRNKNLAGLELEGKNK